MKADITLGDFVDGAQLAALLRPTGEALGLPAQVYTDERCWQLERQRLFATTWLGCAFESDVPEAGSAVPVSVGGWEVIVARGEDGAIRAFHNVCRHRAMRVLDKPCHGARRLTCPWHAWTYDLQGRLVATPNLGGPGVNEAAGIECGKLGLKPVRCNTWMGFVFINMDGAAPPLAAYLASLHARLSDYDLSLLRPDGRATDTAFEGNWKLVVEGGVENYHLPWVHPETGGHQGITREDSDEAGTYVGIATRWEQRKPKKNEKRLPKFPHLAGPPPDDGLGWEDLFLFLLPGTVIEVMPNHVIGALIIPLAPDRTLFRRAVYYVGDAAMTEDYGEIRGNLRGFWHKIAEQDSPMVGRLQKQQALRAELGLPTRFSAHWETAVHRFQKLVVERLR